MREIQVSQITETIARLSQQANFDLPEDVLEALKKARSKEEAPRAQKVLDMAYTHGSSQPAFSAQEVSSNFGAE